MSNDELFKLATWGFVFSILQGIELHLFIN